MKSEGIIWLRDVVDKLAFKHHVKPYEVEEAISNKPEIRFVEIRQAERRGHLYGFRTN